MMQNEMETKYKINYTFAVGCGSFGCVFCAQRTADNLNICVKQMSKKYDFSEQEIQTYSQSEIEIDNVLITNPHQNLVQIYDVFCGDKFVDSVFIFMEECDGNLSQFTGKTKLDIKDQLLDQLILDVTNGYLKLIQLKIVHGDLKPQNILYKHQNGKTIFKIADFGLRKLFLDEDFMYRTKPTLSNHYEAPENEVNDSDNKGDIFSFGIILLEIMTRNL